MLFMTVELARPRLDHPLLIAQRKSAVDPTAVCQPAVDTLVARIVAILPRLSHDVRRAILSNS